MLMIMFSTTTSGGLFTATDDTVQSRVNALHDVGKAEDRVHASSSGAIHLSSSVWNQKKYVWCKKRSFCYCRRCWKVVRANINVSRPRTRMYGCL